MNKSILHEFDKAVEESEQRLLEWIRPESQIRDIISGRHLSEGKRQEPEITGNTKYIAKFKADLQNIKP